MYLHSVVIISNHIVKIVSLCIFVIVYWCFMYLLKYYRRGNSVLRTVLSRSGGNICSDCVLKVKTTCFLSLGFKTELVFFQPWTGGKFNATTLILIKNIILKTSKYILWFFVHNYFFFIPTINLISSYAQLFF